MPEGINSLEYLFLKEKNINGVVCNILEHMYIHTLPCRWVAFLLMMQGRQDFSDHGTKCSLDETLDGLSWPVMW